MSWSVLAGAGGTTVCTMLAAVFAILVVSVVAVAWWRRGGDAAPTAPPLPGYDPTDDPRPIREVPDSSSRRELLLHRLDPGLGALGRDVRVVKGSKGDLRLRGQVNGLEAAVDIDVDGQVTLARLDGSFPTGTVVLRAQGGHDDPDGRLLLLDPMRVEGLVGKLQRTKLAAVRMNGAYVEAVGEVRLHGLGAGEEAPTLERLVALLSEAASVWTDREAMQTPAPPSSAPPPPAPPTPEGPPPATNAPADAVKAALSWNPYGDDPEGALTAGARALFDALGDTLEGGELVTPEGDGDAELRGRVNDVPVRLILDRDGAWKVDAEIARVEGSLYVRFDPTLAPKQGDADDDWADQDDIRVFLAKGLYVEATPDAVEIYMHFAERLEPGQLELLRDGMEVLPIDFVWLQSDELEVGGKGAVQDLDDPLTMFQGVLDFVGWLGSEIPGTDADAGAFAQRTCTYCNSRYVHGIRQPACPNCGAAPDG